MENNAVKLSIGYFPLKTDIKFIVGAIDWTIEKMQSEFWYNRPSYDEDSGVYISKETTASENMAVFAVFALVEVIRERLQITENEELQLAETNEGTDFESHIAMTIEREFSVAEGCFIVQLLFSYIEDLATSYEREKRDYYESDGHYTGDPIELFLEQARAEAQVDKELIMKTIKKFSKN